MIGYQLAKLTDLRLPTVSEQKLAHLHGPYSLPVFGVGI
jgi:hypothetical protein